MQAPRRLQLRRGNTAAISTYLGAPGELIVNTDNNTLFVHDGTTVGGIPATTNTAAITSNVSALQSNVSTLTANAGAQAGSIATLTSNAAVQAGLIATLQSDVTTLTANAGAQAGSIATLTGNAAVQAGLIADLIANAGVQAGAIVTANTAMKGYVDAAVAGIVIPEVYGNTNVAAYLTNPLTTLSSLNVTTAGIAQINGTNPGSELVIQTGGSRNFNFRSSGNLEVPGSIIPTANVAYSLGNITHQWKDLFVSNNTIYIGGVPLSIDASGNLIVNGSVVGGNIVGITSINASVSTSTINDESGDFSYGSLSYDYDVNGVTAGGFTINYSAPLVHGNVDINVGNVIVTNIDAVGTIGANVIQVLSDLTSFGASPAPRIYGFSSIATTGSAVNEGNISASGNLVAGRNAYVTGNVIAGNVTTTNGIFWANGVSILSGLGGGTTYSNTNVSAYLSTANITTTGNITAGNITANNTFYVANITTVGASGNISGANYITANYFVGNGALLTGIVSSAGTTYSNANVASYLPTYSGNLSAGGYVGIAGQDGTTVVDFQTGAGTNQIITLGSNYTFSIKAGDGASNRGSLVLESGRNTRVRVNGSGSNVLITAGNGTQSSTWTFANSGVLTFPDGTTQSTAATTYSNTNVAAYLTTANITTTGNITAAWLSGNISITGNVVGTSPNVTIQAGSYSSTFNNQGNVILPNLAVSGNVISGGYFLGNGALLTGIVSGGGTTYSNTNVAAYLTTGLSGTAPQIQLTNATSNYIKYNNVGVGAPTFTTSNVGTRIIYWSSVDATTADYAVGIDAGVLWHGIPRATSGFAFKWYAGTSQIASLEGTGNLAVSGNVSATNFIGNGALLTGIVSGGGTTYSNTNVAAYLGNVSTNINPSTRLTYTLGQHNKEWASAHIQDVYIKSTLQAGDGGIGYSGGNSGELLKSTGSGIAWQEIKTINGNSLFGNGDITISGGGSSYSNANVASYLPTYSGNVSAAYFIGNLTNATGNVYTVGNIIVGVSGYTVLPTTIAQFTGNANTYTQLNIQNISTGTDATSEYVATANNGTDTTFFVDMGIANSNYDVNSPNNSLGTAIFANDSYLYAQGNTAATIGGNLVIGTTTANKSVKIFAGGINSGNIVATVANTGVSVTGNITATNNITATGNVTATYIVTTGGYGNISQVDYITANNVVATANVTVQGMGVTMPNRPAFRVNGSTQNIPQTLTANVNLKGLAITTVYNQGSYFNSTTGIFTAPVAGIYSVGLNARVGTNNALNQIAVLKNGLNSGGNVVCFWETDTNTGTAVHFGVNGAVVLAAGDYLSANILAGNITFDQNDNWHVTYLG